ncbi:MAG: DMT family transporter [Phototrophicaceae bacterium]
MFVQYIGELAALGTSIAFAFGSTLFTLSGRIIGSKLVNRTRLVMALLAVMLIHWIWLGNALPTGAGFQPWFWLGLSGFIGLALGDGLLFQAFVMIGPRLSMLVFSLSPVLGAILAWLFLGENLGAQDILGIFITVGGIILVVTERTKKPDDDTNAKPKNDIEENPRHYIYGILFALGGALGQAGGQVLAKIGLANDFPTFSALLIRIIVATAIIWALTIAQKELMSSYHNLKANPRAIGMLVFATILGPVLGVWLSLVAIQNSPIGIATTLSSLTPIFLIPIAYFVFGDKVTKQAIIGTLIAVAGSTLLFF